MVRGRPLDEPHAPIDPIRLAIPSKGHLYDGIVELLKTAGYKVRRASDRQYEATIAGHPRFHVVFMRPTDIVTQVQEGRCHLGVTGMDVYAEHAVEAEQAVVVVPDLGYGGCRLVVAVPESWIDVGHIIDLVDLTTEFKAAGKTFRVSTKYPALVRQYFRKWGIYYYQLIDSDGALELHPSLGIADIIVDLTSSGTTLKDNRLREIEGGTVLDSAACLIGHAPSLAALVGEGETGPLALLLDAIDGVRGVRGLAPPGGRRQPRRARPRDGRGGRRLPPRPGRPAPRPRRGLGRPGPARLARHRPGRRQASSPPASAPSSPSAPAGSSACPPGSSSTATGPRRSIRCGSDSRQYR